MSFFERYGPYALGISILINVALYVALQEEKTDHRITNVFYESTKQAHQKVVIERDQLRKEKSQSVEHERCSALCTAFSLDANDSAQADQVSP